jgi:hypothetical protein
MVERLWGYEAWKTKAEAGREAVKKMRHGDAGSTCEHPQHEKNGRDCRKSVRQKMAWSKSGDGTWDLCRDR